MILLCSVHVHVYFIATGELSQLFCKWSYPSRHNIYDTIYTVIDT